MKRLNSTTHETVSYVILAKNYNNFRSYWPLRKHRAKTHNMQTMTLRHFFALLLLVASIFSKKRKCKLTWEEFLPSNDWSIHYNRTRKFYFDEFGPQSGGMKSKDYDLPGRQRRRTAKIKNHIFPYALPRPNYELLKSEGFRVSIKGTFSSYDRIYFKVQYINLA